MEINYNDFLIKDTGLPKTESINSSEIREKLDKKEFIIEEVFDRNFEKYNEETKKFDKIPFDKTKKADREKMKNLVKEVVSKKDGKTYKIPVWSDITAMKIRLGDVEYYLNSKTSFVNNIKTEIATEVELPFEKVYEISPKICEGWKVKLNVVGKGIDTQYKIKCIEHVDLEEIAPEETTGVEEDKPLSPEELKEIMVEDDNSPKVEDIEF